MLNGPVPPAQNVLVSQVVKGLECSVGIHCCWKKAQDLCKFSPTAQMCWDMMYNLTTVPKHIITLRARPRILHDLGKCLKLTEAA